MAEAEVRTAFARQAAICTAAGAPFTGRLCGLIGDRLDRSGPIGHRVLGWQGNPSHEGDALPLRLAGGLHALARSGRNPALGAVYPPNAAPDDDDLLWAVVSAALAADAAFLDPWLDGPPQTNEVGRSSALMAGLLVLADRFRLPFALYELGASAGLNTQMDRYGYRLGRTVAGDPASAVQLTPEWRGASPPRSTVWVTRRAGVDRQPLDPSDPETRETLSAYVWADQTGRLTRLDAALTIAARHSDRVEAGDAADWLEQSLSLDPEPGVCRVVMHSIAFQYFPSSVQTRVEARIEQAGVSAAADSPVAWLRYEAEASGFERKPVLRLTVWPGGADTVLAHGHPHGTWLEWL